MKKQLSILSIAAILSAPVLAQQAPSSTTTPSTAQSSDQRGVPGVEMNVGRDGDQKNVDTSTLGAGSATGTNPDGSTMRPMRTDRN